MVIVKEAILENIKQTDISEKLIKGVLRVEDIVKQQNLFNQLGIKLLGVIGYPIAHSLSPIFQNVALKKLKDKYVYVRIAIQPEKFEYEIRQLLDLNNIVGFNITVPFKERILSFADRRSHEVKQIGSANTLKKGVNGNIELYNTDWIGFLNALKEELEGTSLSGKNVLVLGAGGAAKAIVFALDKESANIAIWNRTFEKAKLLAEKFNHATPIEKIENVEKYDIIVNTTSIYLNPAKKKEWLFDYSKIHANQIVFDIEYWETPLLREAKKRGAKTLDGLRMLLLQGVESFKIWFGVEPPVNEMWEALKKAFKERG